MSSPDHPVPSGLINPNLGIYGMAWSPEGQTLIVNGYDEAHSWDVSDWSRPIPLSQPADFTRAAASVLFSPDGYTLATLDMNRSLRLWDASDWSRPVPLSQPLATKAQHGGMVAWSPDGRTLAVSGGDMLVRLWDMETETAVRRICSATGNILTPEQWQRYVPDAVGEDGTVTTIERAPHKIAMAEQNFQRAGLGPRIQQIADDAGRFIASRTAGEYDFIFLDSDRGQYADWWPSLQRILADGFLLVVDNAISHAHQLEDLNRLITASDGYLSSLAPIGKGELLTLKDT
ncbi:hypothetical protein [Saccharopolyspora shandongensis]|uniref:hypothetical protein n=1 Tax=Saccharopolyspora shandongensis TaxID=418495 RepID=UPI0033CF6063